MAKKRSEIDLLSKWDLTKIFRTDSDFDKEFDDLKKSINNIVKYKDILTKSSSDLLEYLKVSELYERRLYKLYYYANLAYDSDTLDVNNQERHEKIKELVAQYQTLTSFFEPTILKENEDYIYKLCDENENLKEYKFMFEKIFRYKAHTLDEKVESVLSKFSNSFSFPNDVFSILTDSDMKFGDFVDDNSNTYELNTSNYGKYLSDCNRTIRKNAFSLLYKVFSGYSNTLASTLREHISCLKNISELRNYDSSISLELYDDNVDISVYNNLIDTVSKNLDCLYKYYDMKKQVLKLDELHMYDIYAPLVKESRKEYSFIEAKQIVIDSLSVLGKDYIDIINKAFDERWIDIYYNEGKRSGAYSSGFYDINPYVLLNFEGELEDVSTLAHELGHSVHTYLSCKNNNYTYSQYSIFVAEVASTVNELLVLKHLLSISKDKNEKLNILNRLLELFKGTIFRQTMFAEFEKDIHELHSNGNTLTSELLSNKYYELVKKYFGPNVVCDSEIKYEWERIPHFYYNFYVYMYATGLSSACHIVNNILSNKEGALEGYMKFLSSGGSNYPINELKLTLVNINDKEVIESAIKMFDEILKDFRTLYFS